MKYPLSKYLSFIVLQLISLISFSSAMAVESYEYSYISQGLEFTNASFASARDQFDVYNDLIEAEYPEICFWGDDELTKAMFMAVVEDNVTKFKAALDAGADILGKDRYGQTVLHHAVYRNSTSVAEYALEKAPELMNILSEMEVDAFVLALAYQNAVIAKILLDKGANPNLEYKGKKLLEWVNGDWETTKVLLQNHANPNITFSTGNPFLNEWNTQICDDMDVCTNEFVLKILDITNVDLGLENGSGRTICSDLALNHTNELEKLITKVGACKWGSYDAQEMRLLMCDSYISSYSERVDRYLDNGFVSPNKDASGRTVLHCAVDHNKKDWVEKILGLEAGIEMASVVDNQANTPMKSAFLKGYSEIYELFIDKGFKPIELSPNEIRSAFRDACNRRDGNTLKKLATAYPDYIDDLLAEGDNVLSLWNIQNFINVDLVDYFLDLLVLDQISQKNQSLIMKLLIEKDKVEKIKKWLELDSGIAYMKMEVGLYPVWSGKDQFPYPVFYAKDEKKDAIESLFWDHVSADFISEKRNSKGQTILLRAVERNDVKLVRKLLSLGGSVANAKNDGGYTPLGLAFMKDYSEIFDLLLAHGLATADEIKFLFQSNRFSEEKLQQLAILFPDYIDVPGTGQLGMRSALKDAFVQDETHMIDFFLDHIPFDKIQIANRPTVMQYLIDSDRRDKIQQWIAAEPDVLNVKFNKNSFYSGDYNQSLLLYALEKKKNAIADILYPFAPHEVFASTQKAENIFQYLFQKPFNREKIEDALARLTEDELRQLIASKNGANSLWFLETYIENLDCEDTWANELLQRFCSIHEQSFSPEGLKFLKEWEASTNDSCRIPQKCRT